MTVVREETQVLESADLDREEAVTAAPCDQGQHWWSCRWTDFFFNRNYK